MKNKHTERKLGPSISLTRHLIGAVLCLTAISPICARASAENLFAVDVNQTTGNPNGVIDEFTPNGVRSTFPSGFNDPSALAFDNAGNLFVAGRGSGTIYKFTPAGVRSIFASGLTYPNALAVDNAGNLFVGEAYLSDDVRGHIYKFTPNGVRTTFAAGLCT